MYGEMNTAGNTGAVMIRAGTGNHKEQRRNHLPHK